MKKCKKCGVLKPLIKFYQSKKIKDGYRNICKECWVVHLKQWRKNNPEKVREHLKRQRERHPEYTKKQKVKYKIIKDKYGLGIGTIQRYGFRLALKIYEKYDRKCAICGEKNDLTLHHKDRKGRNYENKGLKANNSEDNLIVVCRKCHGSIHGKQGKGIKKNKNREVNIK